MSVTSKEKLISKLENNKLYREAYVNEHVKTSVPLQIRHLREQCALTQTQLAEQAKTTQTVISRLEDPNYGNLTLNSLLKIASALDIGLLVKFVPFSRLLAEFQNLSPTALSVQSFTEELATLKAGVPRPKHTISQQSSNNDLPKLAKTQNVWSASSLTEVEPWIQIRESILKPKTGSYNIATFNKKLKTSILNYHGIVISDYIYEEATKLQVA